MASYSNYAVERDRQSRSKGILNNGRNFNKNAENLSKSERLMKGVSMWTSYYRLYPHVFVKDYFGVNLRLFQSIILYFMMHDNYVCYIAARGQGKTFLTAIFCAVRCILFPETKIIIASGRKSQAREVIEKLDDLRKTSPNLNREISDLKSSLNDASIDFHNGSWIKINKIVVLSGNI